MARDGRRGHPGHRRQRADVARGVGARTTWATGRASTWSAGRTSWSTPSPPPASRSSCCSSAAGRLPSRRRRSEGGGDPRVLVPRPGDRPGRGRRAVRRRQPRRQAADHDPAIGRATCPPTTTTSRRRGAATSSTSVAPLFAFGFGLSYTTFAFDEPAAREEPTSASASPTRVLGGRDQHGHAGRRRGRAALHPRRRQQRHAAREGAEGLPAHHARPRARRATVAFDITPEQPGVLRHRHGVRASSPASSASWWAPRRATRTCSRSRCAWRREGTTSSRPPVVAPPRLLVGPEGSTSIAYTVSSPRRP